MRAVAALCCLPLLVLAGCATQGQDDATTDGRPTMTSGATAGPAGNVSAAPLPVPMTRDLYLTASGGLSWEKPEAGTVTSPFNAGQMATGVVPMEFASAALPNGILVPGGTVRLTLWVDGRAGLLSNSQLDMGAWFGGTKGMHVSTFAVLPAPFTAPNTPVELTLEMKFDTQASLLVPVGDQVRTLVVVGGDYAASMARLHVGGEHASRLNFTFLQMPPPKATASSPASTPLSGALQGGPAAVQCTPTPDVLRQHPLDVPANTTSIQVLVEATGTGHTDIDLRLYDGTRLLASALTPLPKEGMYLAGPDAPGLAGKKLTLEVLVCGGTQVTYQGAVTFA